MSTPTGELTRAFVLDIIADDYESFDEILRGVADFGQRCELRITPQEILTAVIDLLKAGLIQAYRLSPFQPAEAILGVPKPDDVAYYYYWPTEKGREAQLREYPDWPFDETGRLRRDWSPPVSDG